MRLGALRLTAVAFAMGVPLFAAALGANPATAAVSDGPLSLDPCVVLRGDADDGRFACVADGEGGRWGVRLDAPVAGAHDLTLTAVHVDARGTRTPFTSRVEGAASWFYTIAPIERAIAVSSDGTLSVELTRVGFRPYPVGRYAFRAWAP